MYFWRIQKLKEQMAARPLSEREALPYLVVYMGLFTAASMITTPLNPWDTAGALWSTVLAVFGTIYIYFQNGGAGGQHFLQRYFAITLVVSIRWGVILMLIMLPVYALLRARGINSEETTVYEFMFFAVLETVFYWRLGHHVRELRVSAEKRAV